MALTSYRWRGLELNDGLTYAVATRDNMLDDIQPSEAAYAYRGERLPLPTTVTVKEASITLNIQIIAANEAQFEERLSGLRRLFHTADTSYYKLERKLPHEQYYLFLSARPTGMTVERLSRKVSVNLTLAEKAWQSDAWTEQVINLWSDNGDPLTVDVTVTNAGDLPVEPLIIVKPLEVATEGPQPIYYHNVTLYYASAQQLKDSPVRLVKNWNTSSMVGAGQMRSDGSDITVFLEDGTKLPRSIWGTSSAREIWILATRLPALPSAVRLRPSPADVTAIATTIPVVVEWGTLQGLPTSGKVCIGDEVISYAGLTILSANGKEGQLTGCVRAQDGTTAQDFTTKDWTWVKFPVTIRIGYGYVNAYANTVRYNNDYDSNIRWPLIDYTSSDNKTWCQYSSTTTTSGNDATVNGIFVGRPLTWRSLPWLPGRGGERVQSAQIDYPNATDITNTIRGKKLGHLAVRDTTKYTRGYSRRERMIVQLNPATGRKVTEIRLRYFTYGVSTGDTRFRRMKIEFGKTTYNQSNGYLIGPNGPYTTEQFTTLKEQYSNDNNLLLVQDTGGIRVDQDFGGCTHLWLRCTEAPSIESPARQTDNLLLHEVEWYLDRNFSEYPVVVFDSTQRGLALGEFPVCMSWRNMSDTKQTDSFDIWPRLVVNAQVSYDCSTYTVSGEPLANCTYEELIWLRLMPGANTIRFVGQPGIGQVQVTLKWKIRK